MSLEEKRAALVAGVQEQLAQANGAIVAAARRGVRVELALTTFDGEPPYTLVRLTGEEEPAPRSEPGVTGVTLPAGELAPARRLPAASARRGASMSDRATQAARQCEAVAHMAETLATVHRASAALLREGVIGDLAEIVGERTAGLMETLGDILNGMDAYDEKKDAWLVPVFEEAQRLWPQETER